MIKITRKKFGITVSYDMGWQRRSSGNNYASLSGHGFLIGAHTRRVLACVVFSKKCSVCESRKRKEKGVGASDGEDLGVDATAVSPEAGGSAVEPSLVEEANTRVELSVGTTVDGEDIAMVGTAAAPEDLGSAAEPSLGQEDNTRVELGVGNTVDGEDIGMVGTAAAPEESGSAAEPSLGQDSNTGVAQGAGGEELGTVTEDAGIYAAPTFVEDHTHESMEGDDSIGPTDEDQLDKEVGTGITAAAPADDCVLDTTLMDHDCTRNYDGSSGAMESDGLLLLMKQLKRKYNGEIWLDYVITDDDTKMKNTYPIRHTDHVERRILGGAYRLTFLSQTGTPIQHIEQSVWPVVSLICAKVRSLLLGKLSLIYSA